MKTQTASTTALKVLNVKGVSYSLHEFEHDPAARRYGTEAADKPVSYTHLTLPTKA